MSEASQYSVTNRELTEMIIRSLGVREGRWVLNVNFAVVSPPPGQPAPGALPGLSFGVQNVAIVREPPGISMPRDLVVDAAKLFEVAPSESPAAAKRRKGKRSAGPS